MPFGSGACKNSSPRSRLRGTGWTNDPANERHLAPLPFDAVAAPTPIAHGAGDVIDPMVHATVAAEAIPGAELELAQA